MTKILDKFSTNKSLVILGIAIFILSMAYMMKTNSVAGKGYVLKDLEKSIVTKQREKARIELVIAAELSIGKLQEKSVALGLTEPESLKYLVVGKDSVALK